MDRDGGALLMATLFGAFPFLLKLYADGGYQGPEFQTAVKRAIAQVNVEIVKRSDCAKGFVVLPKRWIVERTLHGSAAEVIVQLRLEPGCQAWRRCAAPSVPAAP